MIFSRDKSVSFLFQEHDANFVALLVGGLIGLSESGSYVLWLSWVQWRENKTMFTLFCTPLFSTSTHSGLDQWDMDLSNERCQTNLGCEDKKGGWGTKVTKGAAVASPDDSIALR